MKYLFTDEIARCGLALHEVKPSYSCISLLSQNPTDGRSEVWLSEAVCKQSQQTRPSACKAS